MTRLRSQDVRFLPYSYVILKENNIIKAINSDGKVEFKGTDASIVIQSAINALGTAGGKIFIKKGTYSISTSIMLKNNVLLEGEGVATELKLSLGADCDLITSNSTERINFAVLRNMKLNGNYDYNTYGNIINLHGAYMCRLEGLHLVIAPQNGIVFQNAGDYHCYDNFMSNIYILGFKENGIKFSNVNDHLMNNVNVGTQVYASGDCINISGGGSGVEMNNLHLWASETIAGVGMRINASYTSKFATIYLEDGGLQGGLILTGGSNYHNFTNLVVQGVGGDGIYVDSYPNTFVNTRARTCHGNGIVISAKGNKFIGGDINGNYKNGIYVRSESAYGVYDGVILSGLNVERNSAESSNTYDGIRLSNVMHVIITACLCWDYGTARQRYGIISMDSSSTNFIINNRVTGNATGQISVVGGNNVVKFNDGFKTENSGTATISSGSTIGTGLATVPTVVGLSYRGTINTISLSWNTIGTSNSIIVYHNAGQSIPITYSAYI